MTRHWGPDNPFGLGLRFRRDRKVNPDPFLAEPVTRVAAPPQAPAGEPHGVARPEVLAALRARAEAQAGPFTGASAAGLPVADPTLPFALPQLHGVPAAAGVIPFVPLTEPASIYDALGGDTATARPCDRCGALSTRQDHSWRYDALGYWSCPSCQAGPEWRSPSLPGLRVTTPEDHPGGEEMGIMARCLLATDPRSVRQRPDGKWTAAVPVGGRHKLVGAFDSRETAEAAYGFILDAFAEQGTRRDAGTRAA